MALNLSNLAEALANARRELLARRNADGVWPGELSASALSTATAVFALAVYIREKQRTFANSEFVSQCRRLITRGLRWLVCNQNADGGWGDTTLSVSNISTTALCWAALSVSPEAVCESLASVPTPKPTDLDPWSTIVPRAVEQAERWLTRAAGSLDPAALAAAITARYGKDRTFSVPILTMCALAGRLGPQRSAWRFIPQLPFELAALPHKLFKFLRLPVVSYALPALISMGQAHHRQRPTWNPILRLIRAAAVKPTLRVLREIQPASGGFLEATPLTSFVCMSLAAAGQVNHSVMSRGIRFLIDSVRPDGSWPIDTNLTTWVTTLSVNALAAGGELEAVLSERDRRAIHVWLLKQQYRTEHPYTHADPGAWAWTNLSGGVPDADDTAGALVALDHLDDRDEQTASAVRAGIQWLVDLQNRDGGIPTFCRGWGALPFDRSGADLTAHAVLAWVRSSGLSVSSSPDTLKRELRTSLHRAIEYLRSTQRPDGSWLPLWFGNQHAPDDENPTYGTARVLPALVLLDPAEFPSIGDMIGRAVDWLLNSQNADGGWGGAPSTPSSVEETALATHALALCPADARIDSAIGRAVAWLLQRTENATRFDVAPIGFYFAKLWYYERDYPLIFTTAALGAVHARFATTVPAAG